MTISVTIQRIHGRNISTCKTMRNGFFPAQTGRTGDEVTVAVDNAHDIGNQQGDELHQQGQRHHQGESAQEHSGGNDRRQKDDAEQHRHQRRHPPDTERTDQQNDT